MTHQYPSNEALRDKIYVEQQRLGNRLEPIPMENIVLVRYLKGEWAMEDIIPGEPYHMEMFELIYRRPAHTIGIMTGPIDYDYIDGHIRHIGKIECIELDSRLFAEGMKLDG